MNAVTVGTVTAGGALVGALYVAYRQENTAAVVNAVAAVCLTLVPLVVGWTFGDGVRTAGVLTLTLVTAVAGFLHALGMLGRYESVWWWDHLTHTLSAGLVAALLYAGALVITPEIAVAVALAGTFGLGVVWEIGELIAREVADRLDIEPVLVHYGWRDTALDLVFDAVGAALVVALDLRPFVPLVESVTGAA